MQEYLDKYDPENTPRVETNPLIDAEAIVVLGRTLNELMISVGLFIAFALFLDDPFNGLMLMIISGIFLPMYRTKCPPAFLAHYGWSKGLVNKKNIQRIFSFGINIRRFGP